MRSKTSAIVAAILLAGCQVKKRETPALQGPAAGQLPAGVAFTTDGRFQARGAATGFAPEKTKAVVPALFVTKAGRFVIRAANVNLDPGEENLLQLRLVTAASLEAVRTGELAYRLEYDMPTMPAMGVFKSQLTVRPDGLLEGTLDIAHGGTWEIRLAILQGSATLDTLTFRTDVREN